ncbi:site-specific integrase [Clostridium tertium]|uniref:tyrosine-type recombinase/integrase n=1 Tax=Clostridium tertium TaxID=1559 RepID=UPI000BE2969D|nr:site-specific integrase [Clostridium tertium]MDB1924145.1 site-specific integrase [Clostridium tertium]MDB1927344.1 site-specific integrase [Clostridium tertium]MDB1931120.1 site-specific integrase [Clostridium tertium]
MAKTTYRKRVINDKEYYFYRLRHPNLKSPKDLYGSTVKELDSKIKTLINELDNGIIIEKNTFENFFCDWLFDVHLINKKPSTCERYEGLYRNYIKDSSISDINIKDITLRDIQEYYSTLYKKGASISTLKNLNKLISPSIRYAYNNNMIIKDFTRGIVLPSDTENNKLQKKSDVNPFSLDEQIKFLNAIKGNELETLFITALDSGLRQGELLALTWNDIDFDNECIYVNKTVKLVANVTREGREKGEYLVQTPKSEKANRTVVIPAFLVKRLRQHKTQQLENKLRYSNLYQDNSLVFCNQFGKYIDSSRVRKVFKKVLEDNKLKDRKFHDLRHTYATRLFELGEEPKTVQELLGHSNISITLDTYTHVLESMKKKAVSKLNDLYTNMGVN